MTKFSLIYRETHIFIRIINNKNSVTLLLILTHIKVKTLKK